MDAPTNDAIRARSAYVRQRFPDPGDPPDTPEEEALEAELSTWISDAAALVASFTCRAIGDSDGEEVPESKRGLATRAIALKIEQLLAAGGSYRERRRSISRGGIQSFHAGPYGETYFGPEAAIKAKLLDPDPRVHELLWALATDDCRAAWIALWEGRYEPEALPQAFDWARRPGGYGPASAL